MEGGEGFSQNFTACHVKGYLFYNSRWSMLSESVRMPVAFASLPSVRFCFLEQIDTLKHFKDEYLTLTLHIQVGRENKLHSEC